MGADEKKRIFSRLKSGFLMACACSCPYSNAGSGGMQQADEVDLAWFLSRCGRSGRKKVVERLLEDSGLSRCGTGQGKPRGEVGPAI